MTNLAKYTVLTYEDSSIQIIEPCIVYTRVYFLKKKGEKQKPSIRKKENGYKVQVLHNGKPCGYAELTVSQLENKWKVAN